MGEVEPAQRVVVDVDMPEDGLDPVSEALWRAIEWAMARIEVHATVDRRASRRWRKPALS